MTRGGRAKTRDAPERRCIATGESQPARGLIRFVLGPDGAGVPDLAERLPGRGVWVSADRALVDRAVKKRLFGRAFRAQVSVPEGLADRLEDLLLRRLIDTLALARKAGQAVAGAQKVRERLMAGPVGALIQARDGSAREVAKLAGTAQSWNEETVPRIQVLDSTELGLAFGREFAIHAALDTGAFAARACAESARLAGFRGHDVPAPSKNALPGGADAARSGRDITEKTNDGAPARAGFEQDDG